VSFTELHFLRPLWLWAGLLLVLLLIWLQRGGARGRSWAGICDAQLLPYVLVNFGKTRLDWARFAIAAVGIAGIVALAGPTWERLPQPVFQRKSALVIALDLSLSMGAEDVRPSRLARARFKIADILQRRTEGQTALVAFAEDAFTVAPLTDDTHTLINQLPVLTPDIMPSQGSRPDRAVQLADQLLRQAGAGAGDVLLITDGVEPGAVAAFREVIGAQRWRVSVLGIGTPAGAPIPLRGGGFVKGSNGDIVLAGLDEDLLREGARLGHGIYQPLTAGDQDLNGLTALLQTQPKAADLERMEFQTDRWYEQGPWFVLLGLALALAGFRRGYLVLMLVLVGLRVEPANAADWRSWWWRPDQQAEHALRRGDAAQAELQFTDPKWRGAAQYRQGNYPGAIESWQGDQSAEGLYNKGNALAQSQQYAEALQAYEAALALDPKHEDARYNRDLVKQRMDEAPPPSADAKGQDKDRNKDQKEESQSHEQGSNGEAGDPNGQQQSQAQEPTPGSKADAKSGEQGSGDAGHESADQAQSAAAGPSVPSPAPAGESLAQSPQSDPKDEAKQANEQWLRRVPDDPGGLLRRKFYYQYRQQDRLRGGGQGW
jgi:Ca-activated chloride channel homolog